jgi:tRNA threonylcarbamoyladenosine biosynthesis protein TsaE
MHAHSIAHIRLSSEDETLAFARSLAPLLNAGDVVLLEGEIGAGKSFLSRAVIQARLEAEEKVEDVPSPTFTLVQVYDLTDVEIWHCDLYRLTTPEDALELGLEEAFETAICLVEWPDRLGNSAPSDALTLRLSQTAGDEAARDLLVTGPTDPWAERLAPVFREFAP